MMANTFEKRLLARLVARELSQDEMKSVSGGDDFCLEYTHSHFSNGIQDDFRDIPAPILIES